MANITAAMVKELREMTGAGMMECKKALAEVEGEMEKAIDVLRTRGLAAAAKKAGRATNEGTVIAIVSDDAKAGVVMELNCETDFVGMNEKFKGYAERIAKVALASKVSDVEALKAATDENGETVEAILTDCVHVMGENTTLKRVQFVEAGAVASYIHMGGKIGVLVQFDVEGIDPASEGFQAYGRDVAMQVAAIPAVAANRDQVPADVIEHEMSIYKAQAAESGKPEAIQEKIATGRLEKFYKESCLTEQEFVKNSDQTIQQYTDATAKQLGGTIKVANFVRFALGE
jgi:elongation factor Ts